ncbi:hypothetical protein ACYOEI_27870, partial [Singulisphaera rosea]
MALRLILVGLLAGLGMSLPSRQDFQTLGRVAHDWVDARSADHRVARAKAVRPTVVVSNNREWALAARRQVAPPAGLLPIESIPSPAVAIFPAPVAEPSPIQLASVTIPALDVPGLLVLDELALEVAPATSESLAVVVQDDEVPSLDAPILSAPDEPVPARSTPGVVAAVSEVVVAPEPVAA